MKLFKRLIPLFIVSFQLLLTACAVQAEGNPLPETTPSVAPSPTAVPTPTIEPTPPPPQESEVLDSFFNCLYSLPLPYDYREDLDALNLPDTPTFLDILPLSEPLTKMCGNWYTAFFKCVEEAVCQTEDRYPDIVLSYETTAEQTDWRYLGSCIWTFDDAFNTWELFDVNAAVEILQDGTYHLTVDMQPVEHTALLRSIAREDRDLYMNARYIYSYLTTVFDENGTEIDYEQPVLDEAYAASIQMPLLQCDFFDRWYQARSNNTRKHTGLDMRAPADSEIYSCSGGTVLYIGYQDIPGYYVVILDDEGYEWHYYHMIRQTAFLEEGQRISPGELIGHVGNTGNSAVNHLHLALVTPEGIFVRLYDIMNAYYHIS